MKSEDGIDHKLLQKLQVFMKYSVFTGVVIMTLHCACLLCGINPWHSQWICGFSLLGFIMLFTASYVIDLGGTFRAMLGYVYAMEQCIVFQREYQIFGSFLQSARATMLLVGMLLIVLFIREQAREHRHEREVK